ERYRGAHGRQIRIGGVLGHPRPVVGERDGLVGGFVDAYRPARTGVAAVLVLVDVVAQVHDRVQVAAFGEVPVAGEVPGLPVRTRAHAQTQSVHRGAGRRGRTGAAGGRERTVGRTAVDPEPVVVVARRRQTGDVDLDGVVTRRGGARGTGGRDA